MTFLFLIIWIICGVLAFGLTFGHFQDKYHLIAKAKDVYRKDMAFACIFGIIGPFGLIVAVIGSLNHGLKFKFK